MNNKMRDDGGNEATASIQSKLPPNKDDGKGLVIDIELPPKEPDDSQDN